MVQRHKDLLDLEALSVQGLKEVEAQMSKGNGKTLSIRY